MANKVKKKKESKKATANSVIRMATLAQIRLDLIYVRKEFLEDEVIEALNYLKNQYKSEFSYAFSNTLDSYDYIELANAIEEAILATHVSDDLANLAIERVSKAREILVKKYKELGYGLNYFYAINNLNTEILANFKNDMNLDLIQTLIRLISNLCNLITTYLYTFLNYEITKCIINDNDEVEVIYSTKKILEQDQLEYMQKNSGFYGYIEKRYQKYYSKLNANLMRITLSLANIDNNNVGDSSKATESIICFEVKPPFPLLDNNNSCLLTKEELDRIPHNRLYATPSAGIRFDFKDKSKSIDYVEMYENKDNILFEVAFINNGCFLKSDMLDDLVIKKEFKSSYLEEIKKDRIIVKYIFSKKKYNYLKENNIEINGLPLKSITNITFIIRDDVEECIDNTKKTNKMIYNIVLSCMYLAFYDPYKFSSIVSLHNINRTKKSGYIKEDSYRVAHLRKLPANYTASEDAIKNAKKEGFDYIPEGYTFVSASNIGLAKKKVIKVVK